MEKGQVKLLKFSMKLLSQSECSSGRLLNCFLVFFEVTLSFEYSWIVSGGEQSAVIGVGCNVRWNASACHPSCRDWKNELAPVQYKMCIKCVQEK